VTQSILQRIAAGDQTAVSECLTEYGGLVWSIARRLSPNLAEAEDAAQEVFIDLWKHADRYNPAVASEVAFIAMIARRRLIDRQRKRSRSPETVSVSNATTAVAEDSGKNYTEINEEAACAKACMQQLRDDERKVLELSIYHGLSQSRISERTGLPLGTVKTHARRGLIRLREMMTSRKPVTAEGRAP